MADHDPGARVGDHVLQQAAPIGGIDRHIDGPQPVGAEPDAQGVLAVGQPREHPVALPHTRPGQACGRPAGRIRGLCECPGLAARKLGEDLMATLPLVAFEHVAQHNGVT